ncbi:LysR family transcriptional regulator [Nocardia inohanensis]|uniref:LysR family transcriptional regulator n=1 Tax=Nocardia inohanensis TaxID=209246 RepID=UPI000A01D1EA|nr:LysR family transcriptional regulator [Nocardia inohanensis]
MRHRQTDGSLDLTQLRTFLAVYRAGSITAGAGRVGLSQPTVTTQLQALERQLGGPLFERLPRGVTPTPAAHDLAARVAAPLDSLESVTGGAAADVPTPEPPVLLGGPAELLATLVLPRVAPLIQDGVRLIVSTGLADDLLADLRVGKLDIVLSTIRPRGRTVLSEPLADEEFVLVAAPGLAARIDPDRLRANDLTGAPLISYAPDLPILRRYWRHVFETRLEAEPAPPIPRSTPSTSPAASAARPAPTPTSSTPACWKRPRSGGTASINCLVGQGIRRSVCRPLYDN